MNEFLPATLLRSTEWLLLDEDQDPSPGGSMKTPPKKGPESFLPTLSIGSIDFHFSRIEGLQLEIRQSKLETKRSFRGICFLFFFFLPFFTSVALFFYFPKNITLQPTNRKKYCHTIPWYCSKENPFLHFWKCRKPQPLCPAGG